MKTAVIAGLLVASLGVNAYLVATRPTSASVVAETAVAGGSSVAGSANSAGSSSAPKHKSPYADLDTATLERRLALAESELAKNRRLDEVYAQAQRTPASEVRARATLDKLFGSLSSMEHPYDVECHDAVCKITVLDKDLPMKEWQKPIQIVGPFDAMSFGEDGSYFGALAEPSVAATNQLWFAIVDAIKASTAIETCAAGDPNAAVDVTVTLDASRHLAVAIDPDGSSLATCVRAPATAAVARVAVAQEVVKLDPVRVRVPFVATE